MIKALYNKDLQVDEITTNIFSNIVPSDIKKSDDDFFLLIVGATGTGKSALMQHIYELYDSEGCDVKYIGADRSTYALALKLSGEKPGKRFCCNDEANYSNKDTMTSYNKDTYDLFMSNRGGNVFHVWNNPSLESLDKSFIKERIKGVIYVFTKNNDGHPRLFYYFHVDSILDIFEKEGGLSLKILRRNAKKFAYYRGWFRDYKGKLYAAYKARKDARIKKKNSDFYAKWGEDESECRIPLDTAARMIKSSATSIRKYILLALDDGSLVLGEDIDTRANGSKVLSERGMEKVKMYIRNHSITSVKPDAVLSLIEKKRKAQGNRVIGLDNGAVSLYPRNKEESSPLEEDDKGSSYG